jgi:two-component system, chemotaxis family, protein-glutamate methylesterase/glutaminase
VGDSRTGMSVRLMIVDDRGDVRDLLRAIVEDAAEDVVVSGEAAGARAALDAIDRVDPDVVVLDAFLPDLSGLEAAPLILERRPGQVIVLCTGILDEEVCDRAEEVGIAACLPKEDLDTIPRVAVELATRS